MFGNTALSAFDEIEPFWTSSLNAICLRNLEPATRLERVTC